jgi:hypothetical protein
MTSSTRKPVWDLSRAKLATAKFNIKEKSTGEQQPITGSFEFEFIWEFRKGDDLYKSEKNKLLSPGHKKKVREYIAAIVASATKGVKDRLATSIDYKKLVHGGVTDFKRWYITEDDSI